jgi:hypothetical protein
MQNWSNYVDLLKGHDDLLNNLLAPVDDHLRGDVMRQFVMNLSQGYFIFLQTDPDFPQFVPFENSAFLLQPNPDAVYYYTRVDGQGRYRVTGERGNAPVAGFATGSRIIGTSDTPGQGFGNFDLDHLTLDADGHFDVLFSSERPDGYKGDWQHLHPDADFILLRQFSYDWGRERDVRVAIERLDTPSSQRPRITPQDTDRFIRDIFAYSLRLSKVAQGALRRPYDQGYINRMHLHDFADLGNGNDWPQAYFETVFELAEDEALVMICPLPEVNHYWNVQVVDGLWNQVDIPYRQSSLNGLTAKVSKDGQFRAVLSQRDPGYANWLDTGGHNFGMVIGRWYRCSSHPTPQLEKMKLSDVPAFLGTSTPVITPDERKAMMRARLIGNQMRRKW